MSLLDFMDFGEEIKGFSRIEMIAALNKKDQTKFDKTLSPYTYTIDNASSKTTTIVVRAASKDRGKVKTEIESKLKKANFSVEKSRAGGSTGSSDINFAYHLVKIVYKPASGSGGMSETTLNSTITELVPAIAFMNGYRSGSSGKNITDYKKLYESIQKASPGGVYLNNEDSNAGSNFISLMPTSSKFKEKMENAIAVLKFLTELNAKTPISQIYWGYRAKPRGVPATHKGDIFIRFANGKFMGVSLKAGGEKTAEPQLNTYVNKFFDDYGREKEKQSLIKKIYGSIHSTLGLPENWADRSNKSKSIDTIEKFKKKNPEKYEKLYDQMLMMIRQSLIDNVNRDMNATIGYIQTQIIKSETKIPLQVVKAYGTDFKFVTDEDELGAFIPQIKSIKAYASESSKQNWHIDLIGSKKTITMNMTVRSNKTDPENKVAQGYNLAIKFNGIAKK